MNTSIAQRGSTLPALQMDEAELFKVLRSSLYPGAAEQSIKMVIGYCRAAALDPMQKPVHIVPMWDRKTGEMRDVIMPGVGLYRTQAARSGEVAGISEPDFGADVTETIGGVQITYPSFCRVTVKRRLKTGEVAEFTAVERWKENFAVKGGKEKSIAPNAMWEKRPYGQLAKCAQAQALRMAFPEMTGSAPTADEMEGKSLDADATVIDCGTGEIVSAPKPAHVQALPSYSDADLKKNLSAWKSAVSAGKITTDGIIAKVSTKAVLSDAQKTVIEHINVTLAADAAKKAAEQTSVNDEITEGEWA